MQTDLRPRRWLGITANLVMRVSDNYHELTVQEAHEVAATFAEAWKSSAIPARQLEIVKPELEAFRRGATVPVFDAVVQCFRLLQGKIRTVLDVGASAGYYGEVLDIAKVDVHYTALDYSEAFERLAHKLYPGIDFQIGDACALPFGDNAFDVVLTGGTLMHIADYAGAIHEAARVAHRYVILHRTPVVSGETRYFTKDGYGVEMLEIHFSEAEIIRLMAEMNFTLKFTREIFRSGDMAHKTFLFEYELPHHPV